MIRIVLFACALMLSPLAVATAAAQGSYLIQPGDTLRVEVLEDESLNRNVLVPPDGRISLPLAGSVRAGGRTVEQIERAVTEQLAPGFAVPPTVFVALTGLGEPDEFGALITIHVIGQANQPGPLRMPEGATLLQAFSAMGGFNRFAATRRVQLRRVGSDGEERVFTINYREVERGAIGGGAIQLMDGDVIIVPERRLFE